MDLPNHEILPAEKWLQDRTKEIMTELEVVSIPKLQIILLLIYDRIASGKITTAWYLTAMAARIAKGLRLNYPTDAVQVLNQECRRRLMWCTYLMDRLTISEGQGYSPLCPRDDMHVQLPCNARCFDLEIECRTAQLHEMHNVAAVSVNRDLGISAFVVYIIDLRDRLRRYLIDYSAALVAPWDGGSGFWSVHQSLTNFEASLPADLKNTEKAQFMRVNTLEHTAYIMLHTWWHTCCCELFSHFITDPTPDQDSRRPPEDFVTFCYNALKWHSVTLNAFWSDVKKLAKAYFVTDWQIASCVYLNTKALLLLSKAPSAFLLATADIEPGVRLNMQILDSLAPISPYVASWVSSAFRDGRQR